jgi:NADH-quinone oxidoreductase subunit G
MADTEREAPPEVVTLTVDGREIEARPGELVIAAAERNGTYIPRFCYHPRMQPVGMCRMCIVEIDTGRGPALQPACMIPVADGMTVATESPVTKKAQDGVLEFLLINHPLDCPVCDKGGECPLQDQTLAFGPGESRFVEEKRHYEKPIDLSPLVQLDRERCILCDRCTRFSKEVAGDPLISFIDRGGQTQVNTFPDDPFASYFSGNTVQICPVGALLARPYRFKARPWDLDQVESTCTMCSFGCRVAVQSSTNRLVRKLGVDVDPVNWGWLCDKGRFDFEWVNSDARLTAPLVRQGDELVEASWSAALTKAAEGLTNAKERHGAGAIGVLGGARGTNEDAYAWSKLARTVLGTDNVDAQLGDGLPAELVVGLPRATIDAACAPGTTVVVLAPDLKEELPVLYLRLRDAVNTGDIRIVEIASTETSLTRYATASLRHRPGEQAAIVSQARDHLGDGAVVCILGRPNLAESADAVADAAAALLDAVPGVTFLSALRRSNVHGAIDMGLAPGLLPGRVTLDDGRGWFSPWGELPAERGLDAFGILTAAAEGRLQGLVLLGADPLADFPDRDLARRALAGAGFVVAVDCLPSESVRQADVVLPAAAYGEKSGTFTNIEGRISRLNQKVTAPGTAWADWVIATQLARRLGGDLGFTTVESVWDEIEQLAPSHAGITRARLASAEGLDGVVAGDVADVETEGAPPTMAGTEAPEIHAVAAHGTEGVAETNPSAAPDQPDPSQGDAPQSEGDENVAEAMTADDRAEYSDGSPAAASAQELVRDAGEGTVESFEPSGGDEDGPPRRPNVFRYAPSGRTRRDLPPVDSYSLRLVSSRKLYDAGTLLVHSPSMAGLAPGAPLRVNPADLDRLGVQSGGRVRVTSPRTALVLETLADATVPQGTVSLAFNQPGPGAADLIDTSGPVTDLRIETLGDGEPA